MALPITLILIGLATQLYLLNHKLTKPIAAVMVLTLLLGFYHYSGKLRWFQIAPKDPIYVSVRGHKPLKSYLHWHEIFHYYIGAKYFPELGYNGLYETVLLADRESLKPAYNPSELRSLRAPTQPISVEEGLRRAKTEFRPKFSPERWESFTRDVEQLKSVGFDKWMDTFLFDAGYNPPPSWAVFGYTIANLVPIDQAKAWFDGRPSWYQIEFLPLFDVLLLCIALGLLWRSFGFPAFAAFLILFLTSRVASFGWISGGFFRYTWLFGLIAGICMLKEKRYFWAGMALGLAAMDRIFPVVFTAGAALPLCFQYLQNRKRWRPLVDYSCGAAIVVCVLFVVSIFLFGLDAWAAFFTKIGIHKDLFFVHHIGYRRIAVFDALVPNQNFWWGDGLRRMALWNARLVEKWQYIKLTHVPFLIALVVATIIAARRIKPEESAVLFGGVTLFCFAMPANYYYIYFPLTAVVLLAANRSLLRDILLVAVFALWAYLQIAPRFSPDDLVQNYAICWGFLIFFILWSLTRSYEVIRDTL